MLNPTLVGLLLFRAKTAPKIMGKWQAGVIMMTTISPQSYFFMLLAIPNFGKYGIFISDKALD